MATADVTVPFFKKKGKGRPATTRRQRSASPDGPGAAPGPLASSSASTVVLPTRKAASNLLSAGTKRKRADADADADADDGRDGPDVQWTAAGSHQHAAQAILDGDEAAALLAKRARDSKRGADEDDAPPDDGLYRGQAAYKSHLVKSKEVPKAMRAGPQRSATTIRQVTIVDYQPDVCKDYKETGYCGFGDTCKFLHDRGTYLQGWQLDKLADAAPKDARDASDSDSDEEALPFACLICRNAFTDPVVTRCGHYFCSACAIKRFAKTPKCAACLAPTGGIFNRADKVLEKRQKVKDKKHREGDEDEEARADAGGAVQIEGLGGASESEKSESDSDEDED